MSQNGNTRRLARVLGWLRRASGDVNKPATADESARASQPAGSPQAAARAAHASVPLPELHHGDTLCAQAFVHNAHGIAIVDPVSGTLRTVNAAFAQLVGREPEQLRGQPALCVYPATEHVALSVTEHSADLTGTAAVQTCQLHRDGTLIPVELSMVSVREGGSQISCRIHTVTDLRARLRAEGEMRFGEVQHTAAARFRQLADCAPVGILLMDAEGDCNFANPCWLQITELALEQARGDGWWEAVHPDDRERLSDAWEQLTRGAQLDLEFRYRRATGEVRWVHSRAAALCDDAGTTVGYICVDADVSEQLRQRAAIDGFHGRIRALAHRLERLREDERADLARRLHGTLRQDLTTLKGEVEALHALGAGQASAAALGAVVDLAERCLQDLRHIAFELQPPGVEDLGLGDAMKRYADEWAAQSGVAIDLSCTGTLPELGRRRSLALYRTLQEGLTNVARHARAKEVEAHIWVHDGAVRLRICDDGVGIGDKDRSKAGCFGLLSMSERLAQLGGALRVFGVAGRGTTLDASVPCHPSKGRRDSIAG